MSATGEGHVEVVKWAGGNGCPWGEKTLKMIKMTRDPVLEEWARANGAPETFKV